MSQNKDISTYLNTGISYHEHFQSSHKQIHLQSGSKNMFLQNKNGQ